MPEAPSSELLRQRDYLRDELEKLSSEARDGEWQRTVDFCARHRAERSLIPDGLAAGFPDKIEFLALQERIETGWVCDEIRRLLNAPRRHGRFIRAAATVLPTGKNRKASIIVGTVASAEQGAVG